MRSKYHVWVSVSSDLEHDARRDLTAVGWPLGEMKLRVVSEKDVDDNLVGKKNGGVQFLTYSLLAQKPGKKADRSRLEQLIACADPAALTPAEGERYPGQRKHSCAM